MGEAWYATQGIDVVDTARGGRVTYHGPGQLVGYAIMRVDDVRRSTCARWSARSSRRSASEGIDARARVDDGPDFTGVWVGERKIASIGVHVSSGVTAHGFAVNVDNDLQPFEWVVPAGCTRADDLGRRETGARPADLPCFRKRMAYAFAQAHGRRQRLVARLERLLVGGALDSTERVATRSRANPGGMDVLKVLGPDVRPLRERKPPWFKVPRARRRALPRADAADQATRTCTPSARRPPARTSASAGSAAPRRS